MEYMMNFNSNPLQLAGLLRTRNPQELIMSMLQNNNLNDPFINELVGYAQRGDTNSLVNVAQNLFAKQGKDFNQEYQKFMSMLQLG